MREKTLYAHKAENHMAKDKLTQFHYFSLTVLLFGIAVALFRGVLDNYLAHILEVSKADRGVVEFFRELPGLFLVVILAFFYRFPENRILQFGYIFALVGVTGFFLVGKNLIPAIALLMLWSTGVHIAIPLRQAYAVNSVEPGQEGKALGTMQGILNIGKVTGFFLVPIVFFFVSGEAGYRTIFIAAIILVGLSIIISFKLKSDTRKISRQRLYFAKKYSKYYLLQIFYGARKQVFLTFGPYALILMYGASVSVISTLLAVSAALNIFISPIIGKTIDRIGFKAVMVGDTVILFFVCMVYGFAHHIFPQDTAYIAVIIAYILDNILSNASMAGGVYVKSLSSDRDEMTATLTTGLSIDHLISIVIAVVGGFVWQELGVELLFIMAGVMALANSAVALTVNVTPNRAAAQINRF